MTPTPDSSRDLCLFCATKIASPSPLKLHVNGEEIVVKTEEEESCLHNTIFKLPPSSPLEESESERLVNPELQSFFIVRKILDISPESLEEYLGYNEGLLNPSNWFRVCPSCQTCVFECYQLHCKILQYEERLSKEKRKLKETICQSELRKDGSQPKQQNNEYIFNSIRTEVVNSSSGSTEFDDSELGLSSPPPIIVTVYDNRISSGSVPKRGQKGNTRQHRWSSEVSNTPPATPNNEASYRAVQDKRDGQDDAEGGDGVLSVRAEATKGALPEQIFLQAEDQPVHHLLQQYSTGGAACQENNEDLLLALASKMKALEENVKKEKKMREKDKKKLEKVEEDLAALKTRSAPKTFTCKFCGKVYAHCGSLSKHVRGAHKNMDFKCSGCSKTFKRLDIMQRHEKQCCQRLISC